MTPVRLADAAASAHLPPQISPATGPWGTNAYRRPGLAPHASKNVPAVWHTRPTTFCPCAPQGQQHSGPGAHKDTSNAPVAHTPNSFWPCVPHGQNKPGPWVRHSGTAQGCDMVAASPRQDAPYDTSHDSPYNTAYSTAWARRLACGVAAAAFVARGESSVRARATQRRHRSAGAPMRAGGAA
jgi:hypothetical protein